MDLEQKADQVGSLLSSTIASLAEDARALKHLKVWKQILEKKDDNDDSNAGEEKEDDDGHVNSSKKETKKGSSSYRRTELIQSLHDLDEVVSTVENKVGILRQIVTEEQRALDHLENIQGAAQEQNHRLQALWDRCNNEKKKKNKEEESCVNNDNQRPPSTNESATIDIQDGSKSSSLSPKIATSTALTSNKNHNMNKENKENNHHLSSKDSMAADKTDQQVLEYPSERASFSNEDCYNGDDDDSYEKTKKQQPTFTRKQLPVAPKPLQVPPAVHMDTPSISRTRDHNNKNPSRWSDDDDKPSTSSSSNNHNHNNHNKIHLERVTRNELESISRTVRGRVTPGALNEALKDLERVFTKKATEEFRKQAKLHASKQEALSNYHYLHASYEEQQQQHFINFGGSSIHPVYMDDENNNNSHNAKEKDYYNYHNLWSQLVVSEEELRRECPFFLAGEGTARTILTVLKTLRRIQQVRVKKGPFLYKLILEE